MKKTYFISAVLFLCMLGGGLPCVYGQEDDSDTFMLEEITVTSEKREVNVQDTPMSITAISGAELSGKAITNLDNALQGLAGVNILSSPGGGNVFIRGVGSGLDTNLADPSVSIQLDNAYFGRMEVISTSMYDIERVEVLRGPQGTLYGRNAAGGQVNVVTKKPTDKFELDADLTIGDYNLKKFSSAVNAPLSDKWAARFAVNRETRDGYISDGSNSADIFAGRGKLSYKPTDDLSFLFTFDYSQDKSNPNTTVPLAGSAGLLTLNRPWAVPDADYDGVADDFLDANGEEVDGGNGIPDIVDTGWPVPEGSNAWTQDPYHRAPQSNNEFKVYQLEINYDLGWGDFVLVPTYNDNSRSLRSNLVYGDAFGTDDGMLAEFTEKQFSAETRLQSSDDAKIQWLLGVYYLDSENKNANSTVTDLLASSEEAGGGWTSQLYRRPNDTYAYFGQATYPLTEQLRLTGGVRYTRDERNLAYRFANWDITDTTDNFYDAATVTTDGRHEYDSGVIEYEYPIKNTTYRAGVEYDVNEGSMLYAYVSTGFKAGGLNVQGAVPPVPYDPEELMAYSIGSKNRLFNNRLQLNSEAYYYDYDGYQIQAPTEIISPYTGLPVNAQLIVNAETGHNMGLEIETDYLITEYDRVTANVAYMDTEFGKIILPGSSFTDGEPYDLTGEDMSNAPELSGTLGYEHTWVMDNGASVAGRIQTKLSKGYYTGEKHYYYGIWQDDYHISEFYLTYAAPSGKYSVGMWCKNLENEVVVTRTFSNHRVFILPPRTFGMNFSVRF